MNDRRGLLIILSSPSGAGKSTLAKRLRVWDPELDFSVSATTRSPRKGEVDGADYHFMEEAEFKGMVADGEMLEHAHVFGNFYGSPKGPIEETINTGRDVLFDIDWQGANRSIIQPLVRTLCRYSYCHPLFQSFATVSKNVGKIMQKPSAVVWKKAGMR